MMAQTTYGQFCPVAMAAEILCTRWTVVLLRELIAGSTRFNDLRRGLPRMSPALLSQRLKELEAAGIIHRQPSARDAGVSEYRLTEAGRELEPLVEAFGLWGHRWVDSELSLQRLDAPLLMWDMRRNLDPRPLPEQRTVVQFRYPELPADRRAWWLMIEPGAEIDLCSVDPGFDVDLYVSTDLRTMTAIWMGPIPSPSRWRRTVCTSPAIAASPRTCTYGSASARSRSSGPSSPAAMIRQRRRECRLARAPHAARRHRLHGRCRLIWNQGNRPRSAIRIRPSQSALWVSHTSSVWMSSDNRCGPGSGTLACRFSEQVRRHATRPFLPPQAASICLRNT